MKIYNINGADVTDSSMIHFVKHNCDTIEKNQYIVRAETVDAMWSEITQNIDCFTDEYVAKVGFLYFICYKAMKDTQDIRMSFRVVEE